MIETTLTVETNQLDIVSVACVGDILQTIPDSVNRRLPESDKLCLPLQDNKQQNQSLLLLTKRLILLFNFVGHIVFSNFISTLSYLGRRQATFPRVS